MSVSAAWLDLCKERSQRLIPNPAIAFAYSLSPWERVGVRAHPDCRTTGPDLISSTGLVSVSVVRGLAAEA